MVLLQALAAGLPVTATDQTGGPDLAAKPGLSDRVFVAPAGDVETLAKMIKSLECRLLSAGRFTPLAPELRESLSWSAYGRRYSDELLRDVPQEKRECAPSTS